jgi:P27 family predicted phage terminase small subunit
MTAGRKPLPLAMHKLNGNPSKKPLAELYSPEPELSEECPVAPTEILEDKEALEEWNRIVPDLYQAGLIKQIDRGALAQYCCCYSEWIHALKSIRKARLIRNKNGTLTLNPSFKIMRDASATMLRLLAEFGMTPSSRARLRAPAKQQTDELDDELFG